MVPADCILFEEMHITCDEKEHYNHKIIAEKEPSYYNENEDMDNHHENPDIILLTGSKVMTGGGKAVVCCVGDNTHLKKHTKRSKFKKEEFTDLENKL